MKWIKRILIGLAVILLVVLIAVFCTWRNEISTLASFEQLRQRNDAHLDGSVYAMHVKGDFYLDDFVAQGGVKSDGELIDFVTARITKGLIPM